MRSLSNYCKYFVFHHLSCPLFITLSLLFDCSGLWIARESSDKSRDPYRKILLQMFRASPEGGVTKDQVLKEIRAQHGSCNMADSAFRTILKEVAVLMDGYYYYKASKKVQELISKKPQYDVGAK